MTRQLVLFCDFDGTITENDNIIAIMKQFAPPEWEALKDDILAERISVQEGVGKMFSLLPSSLKGEIVDFLRGTARLREGFREFAAWTKEQGIPLYVVSGGIDFLSTRCLTGSSNESAFFATAPISAARRSASRGLTRATASAKTAAAAASRRSFASFPARTGIMSSSAI